MLKTYQFKIHCKGDSHSSKTANIKAKYSRLRLFNLGGMIVSEMTYTVSSGTLNSSIPYHWVGWVVSTEIMQFNESE